MFSVEQCGTKGGGLRETSDGKEVRDAKSVLRHANRIRVCFSSCSFVERNSLIFHELSSSFLLSIWKYSDGHMNAHYLEIHILV